MFWSIFMITERNIYTNTNQITVPNNQHYNHPKLFIKCLIILFVKQIKNAAPNDKLWTRTSTRRQFNYSTEKQSNGRRARDFTTSWIINEGWRYSSSTLERRNNNVADRANFLPDSTENKISAVEEDRCARVPSAGDQKLNYRPRPYHFNTTTV